MPSFCQEVEIGKIDNVGEIHPAGRNVSVNKKNIYADISTSRMDLT